MGMFVFLFSMLMFVLLAVMGTLWCIVPLLTMILGCYLVVYIDDNYIPSEGEK